MPYTATEEARGVYRLDDGKMSSFYLVKGEKSALLIDTGMGDDPLLPFLRSLTDLPVALLVTHGHGDHMKHANEFETAYLNPKDISLMDGAFRRLGIPDTIDPSVFLPVQDAAARRMTAATMGCKRIARRFSVRSISNIQI